MAFTRAQQQAIDHDGHMLIVAGPGSGKTTTSVAKAMRILADPRRSLIMVTFTKEGAVEMRRRLDAAQQKAGGAPFREERLIISTFHSIAIKHLYRHTPRQKVLSPVQQNILLNDAMSMFIHDAEEQKAARQGFESYMYAVDRSSLALPEEVYRVIQRYSERLRDTGHTDLYSIMRDCALRVHEGTIPPMPFTDMLVDEGQDTDDLQKHWIFAHARAGCRVTIVGDDDQSIYEWRQALGYAGMKSFMDTFRAKRIELGDNFRCRSEILSHAVTLVGLNKARLEKTLVARRGKGGSIGAYNTASATHQARELAALVAETPAQHSNAVVLARKNRSLDLLEMELRAEGVEYMRLGKSIWDNPNIAGYLSFLQTLLDNSPVGVLGVMQYHGISEDLKSEVLRSMDGSAATFLDGEVPDLDHATAQDHKNLQELANSCAYWRKQLRASRTGVTGSVREVILEVGSLYSGWMKRRHTSELVDICSRILSDLSGTLSSRLKLVSTRSRDLDSVPLVLMTMHGSKGLEFETVHVIDASASDTDSHVANYEAERRLMYVALTRAKNRCMVWYSGKPHMTVTEARIPVKHRYEEVKELLLKGN
ncbi:MAG: ATP-dependent helicase [Hydrogenophaga sp.]|uniref:UvrD-helicase domain-containing protein n=1 Tax=Hydrogenophaga sp. TaxID=1904254 RepID=UPI002629786C|nr:ATP-dependent helicase [Hydrogenophaga sp.]MCV0439043.1 ATP-dependent helicase [Hydrogenophaga sp.]